MLLRGIASRRSPSIFAIVAAALVLVGYFWGAPVGPLLLLLIAFPATVGGLLLYFDYGWRRAVLAAVATLLLVLALGGIDWALGSGNTGVLAPASAR